MVRVPALQSEPAPAQTAAGQGEPALQSEPAAAGQSEPAPAQGSAIPEHVLAVLDSPPLKRGWAPRHRKPAVGPLHDMRPQHAFPAWCNYTDGTLHPVAQKLFDVWQRSHAGESATAFLTAAARRYVRLSATAVHELEQHNYDRSCFNIALHTTQ